MESKQGYSRLTDGQLMGLQEAGASASEILAYAVLTRKHEKAWPDNDLCWASASLIAERTGMSEQTAMKALQRLCRKYFTVDGQPVAVLHRITGGNNGRATRYYDNLWREVRDGRYPNIKDGTKRHQ